MCEIFRHTNIAHRRVRFFTVKVFGRGGFVAEAVVNVLLTTEVKLEHFLRRNGSKD